MIITSKNSKRVTLAFSEALEAYELSPDVKPHIGRIARLKYELDTERAFGYPEYEEPTVKTSLPAEDLPTIAESIADRIRNRTTDMASHQLAILLRAQETVSKFLADQNN